MASTIEIRPTLRLLRVSRNKTISDVAKATGVTPQAVAHWEEGKTIPRVDKAKRLADFYGISLEDIVLLIRNQNRAE